MKGIFKGKYEFPQVLYSHTTGHSFYYAGYGDEMTLSLTLLDFSLLDEGAIKTLLFDAIDASEVRRAGHYSLNPFMGEKLKLNFRVPFSGAEKLYLEEYSVERSLESVYSAVDI